jgi:outer membrane receptor for ferrienterochelin and colicin
MSLFTNRWYLVFAVVIGLICSNSSVQAGTTGKLAGKVTDRQTKEALYGVNISVLPTKLGGISDAEGKYYVLNLPPGVYQVRASYLGYTSITVQNIKISADQTTHLDIELSQESLQLQTITVVSDNPTVRKDLTSTESKITGDDISMLPVEDLQSVVNLQAGVVEGHFRGGRSGEVKYLIDGVSVNDAYSGQSALEAEVNSIQELQVLTGTFNAEYGEALSGVVNQITKVAGETYQASASAYSGDYVSNHSGIFQNINQINPFINHNVQATLSGPVPGTQNGIKFFLSGRYNYDDGYIYGKRQFNPKDSSNFSANDPSQWYIGATGDNKYVPMNFSERATVQGKLQFKVGKGKGIILNGMYQHQFSRDYDHQFTLNPDGDYKNHQNNYLGSISYTHMFTDAAFLDLMGSYVKTDFKRYVYENPLDPNYVNPDRMKDVSGNSFLTGGTQNWHFYHTSSTMTAKVDYTNQVNQIHQIKTGFEYNYHTLDYKDFQIEVDALSGYKPRLPEPGSFDYNVYKNHPVQFAYYIQDKIELDYLVVNVGARFDLFQPDGQVLKNPDKINVLEDYKPPFPDSLFYKAKVKSQISPRLGISYPMGDKGAIHISYGHFFQIPPFQYLYKNPNFRIPLTGNYPDNIGTSIGNADLKPQQTTMYEIGLQQELLPNFGMNFTVYYKDIRNLLGTEIHYNNQVQYAKYVNRDYGAVNGFTLSFDKRFVTGFGATLDYTYQTAKGNASDPNDAYTKSKAGEEVTKQLVPLDWDRRHSINFTLTFGHPSDYIASVIGRFGTGLPYTPSLQQQRTGLENSENRPSTFTVDLYFTKYYQIATYNLAVFLKVYNLFDTENEINVFTDTGRAGYTLDETRAQSQPRGANTLQEFFVRPDFYSAPRQVVVGVSIDLK